MCRCLSAEGDFRICFSPNRMHTGGFGIFQGGGGAPVGNPSERSERVLRGLGLRENES